MKTTIYPSNSSDITSGTSNYSTRVEVFNHMDYLIFNKKIIILFGSLILLLLFPYKTFSQGNGNGNGGKVCLISGASSACGSQNLTYTMTNNGGVNNPTSYTWSLTAGSTATFCSATNGTVICVSGGVGVFTLNLTVQGNGNGNKATCSQVVTINPLPNCSILGNDPTCTSLTNIYSGADAPAGKTYGYSWSISGAINASILGATNSKSLTVVSGSCNSSYTLHLTVTDLATGCISQCSRGFGFIDNIAPSISAAGNNMIIDCPAEPIFSAPSATDACSSATVIEVSDNTTGDACNYTRTKTWKAVDACGNESGLVSQAITVHDVTPPAISVAGSNKTINCPDVPIFTAPKGSDICSAFQLVEVSDITLGGICSYTRTKTWKVVDACGNESELVSQTITVQDTTAPIISAAGPDGTIECPSEPVFTPPTGSDECGSVQVFEVSDNTVGNGCNYTRTKTWKAVDVCGNQSGLVSQSITVRDLTAPSISGEGNDLSLEGCNTNIVFTAPIASDLCDSNPTVNVVNTFTVQNPDGSITYTRIWNAVDQCNNTSSSVDQSITVGACETFCTASQGFYGNTNGLSLIPTLLSQSDLVLGKPGKSFTVKLVDALCLNNNLPSGGPAKMLPPGDAVYNGSCGTTTSITLNSNGRFDNILLGQTITLGLNLRKDSNLGGLILMGTVMTTSNGTKTIPLPVLNALTSIYGARSVANLFDLANRALGGMSTNGVSFANINDAVSAINEGFDECGTLSGFSNNLYRNISSPAKNEIAVVSLNAIPNPFDNNTSLEFVSQIDAKVKVEIYNVAGVKVASLFNDHVRANEKNVLMFESQHLSNGIYIYVLTANDKVYYHKLLLVRQ